MSQSNFVKKKLELRIKKNVNYVPVKSTSSFSFVSLCLPPWSSWHASSREAMLDSTSNSCLYVRTKLFALYNLARVKEPPQQEHSTLPYER